MKHTLNEKKDTLCYSEFFLYGKKNLAYNRIPFNNGAERAIEIPIAFDFLYSNIRKFGGLLKNNKRVLEVGNVLSNYENLLNSYLKINQRDIIDKFEPGINVKNIDLMEYNPYFKYNLIVSISTVEHIGQHPDPSGKYGENDPYRDKEAPLKAIIKIYDLLDHGGKALITVPFGRLTDLGWIIQFDTTYLNLLFEKYGLHSNSVHIDYFQKLSMDVLNDNPFQSWVQCEADDLAESEFHSPYPFANGIACIYLYKKEPLIRSTTEITFPLNYKQPVLIGNLYLNNFIIPFNYDHAGIIEVTHDGYVFYGPYIDLKPGRYEFQLDLELSNDINLSLDISSNSGKKVLWQQSINPAIPLKTEFELLHLEEAVEIRLYAECSTPTQLIAKKIMLRKLD